MTIELILLIPAAYLLGSVPAAYLAAKWSRGIDIRKFGSGSVGASNILRTTSKWLVIPVTIFDFGKGMLAIWLAQLLGLGAAEQITVGIFAIIGHNWPIFLRFKGGRGMLTSLGVITMLSPKLGLIILVISYSLAPFKQLAVGVFIALASLPLFSWFLSQPLDIEERLTITMGFLALALLGFIRRLLTPRTELSKSVHPTQLFINRLLFDRDIRNREAWISRRPSER